MTDNRVADPTTGERPAVGDGLKASLARMAREAGRSVDEWMREETRVTGTGFMAHAKWEERNPRFGDHRRGLEVSRLEAHERAHGDTDFFEPSPNFPCPGMLRIFEDHGRIWTVICDECRFELTIPVEKIDLSQLTVMRRERALLPKKFAGVEIERTADNKPVLDICNSWLASYRDGAIPAVGLYGAPGRGKTQLLVHLCERLLEEHKLDVMYVNLNKLLDELMDGFDDHAQYRRLWERAQTVEVLALDDVGAGQPTDWRWARLEALIDARYEEERPLLIATNFAPNMWPERVGHRTASRLQGMVVAVKLLGRDRRPSQQIALEGAEETHD
jgi:IstB-like ATP binding protein